jgi:hypothetical protein
MEELIAEINTRLSDYRADEGIQEAEVSEARIAHWIGQFEEADREFILSELVNIFAKRYCSKASAKKFLKAVVDKLTTDLKYDSAKQFLENTLFLDLQAGGKSQGQMLAMLGELLQGEYGFDIEQCGGNDKKHFVYLDDVLCTGNTLFQNLNTWHSQDYDDDRTNLKAIKDGTADFICTYIFIHSKNYYKKVAQIKKVIDGDLGRKLKMYRMHEIENSDEAKGAYDLIFPLEVNSSEEVLSYKEQVASMVDEYTQKGGYSTKEEFFRPKGRPVDEELFTSADNRNRFETILLEKGIEILRNAHTNIENVRALGYSLKSMKDFGFGALCFTWRNIANNTPLVFWYAGGGFFPLFVKNQTGGIHV